MKTWNLITLFALSLFLSSCFLDDGKVLPASTGKAGELIVLVEENIWATDIQDSLRKYLGYALPGMPKAEAAFRLVQIPKSAFNSVIKTHRNVLAVNIGGSEGIKQVKEKLSDIQLFLKIEANSKANLKNLIHKKGEWLAQRFFNEELKREKIAHKKAPLKGFKEQLVNEQSFGLTIPRDYSIVGTATPNTYHLRKDIPKASMGILISVIPYTSKDQFTEEGIIVDRNKACKPNLLGERSGSYIQTETRFPMELKPLDQFNTYAVRLKGLWNMKNDFMGGPFIHYQVLSPDQSKVIQLDGYVYGPSMKKRNLILELEAVFNSLELIF